MPKTKLVLFVVLAFAGSAAMLIYGASVLPAAPSSFQLAVLVFTAIAAIVGFLGLVVSYLTYRIEAERIPRPDVDIRLPDKTWAKVLRLDVQFVDPEDDFDEQAEARRNELENMANATSLTSLVGGFGYQFGLARFQEEVKEHVREFRDFLEARAIWDAFWKRSYVFVLGVSNDKAGVPASGIKITLRFPEESDGVRVLALSDLPERPEEPSQPSPPRADARLDLGLMTQYTPEFPLIDIPDMRPPGNVSGPEIGRGSVRVTYTVGEVLHNTIESTEDDPIVVSFLRPGKWTVPYEVHARNLPTPRKGLLIIEARESDQAPSYEPPPDHENE